MKIFACFLSLALIFCYGHFPVHSAQSYTEESTTPPPRSAYTYITQALTHSQAVIDLSTFGLTITDGLAIFGEVTRNNPQFFYVGRGFAYTYAYSGTLLTITPTYLYTEDELAQAMGVYVGWIEDFLTGAMAVKSTWSDAEKVLYIHDFLGATYTYSPVGEEVYDVYGLVTQRHGVCQALAGGMIALGRGWGLEVDMVVSAELDHAWNHVGVDGAFYHVDVTRDMGSAPEQLGHDKCLLDDEGMAMLGYEGYTCMWAHPCHSKVFQDAQGNSLLSPWHGELVPVGEMWLGVHEAYGVSLLGGLAQGGVGCEQYDMNQDGRTNLEDLVLFLVTAEGMGDIEGEWVERLRGELLFNLLTAKG